jgi:hypothetical protein
VLTVPLPRTLAPPPADRSSVVGVGRVWMNLCTGTNLAPAAGVNVQVTHSSLITPYYQGH